MTERTGQPDKLLSLLLRDGDLPPRWQADTMMLAEGPRRAWLSTLTVSMPPSVALSEPELYVMRVLRWAAALQPQYGTAGFALVDDAGMAQHRSGVAWPWLERYPGLDCALFNLQPKPARYVSINWLTVLGEPVVEALGGRETLGQRLRDAADERNTSPPLTLPYDGGLLIRATDLPQLGDRTSGDIPAGYRAVNAAVREARFEEYPTAPNVHLIDSPRGRDARQATLDWVRRFDDDEQRSLPGSGGPPRRRPAHLDCL